jgi:hypothetical protein
MERRVDEFERIRKELIVYSFSICLEELKKSNKNFSRERQCPGRHLNVPACIAASPNVLNNTIYVSGGLQRYMHIAES